MDMDEQLLLAWGCPGDYAREWPQVEASPDLPSIAAVAGATNWYHEMDRALGAMVRAGDHQAIRAWADSEAWDAIAVETSDDGDPGTYAEDVRDALHQLAEEVEGHDPR